jgi:hypothetical protein
MADGMTASAYVALLRSRYGVLFALDGARVLFVSDRPLPDAARAALRDYGPQLVGFFLTGADLDLDTELTRREMDELGLQRMQNGRITHPDGDERANEILAGVVDIEDAKRDALRRRVSIGLPPRVEIQAKEVYPGCFTYTEPKGVRAVIMFNGRRLPTE